MTQLEALEILKKRGNVFLTGEPGAGKTYTVNLFIEWLRENGITYAVTASTGIAATHVNGTTIHSWSGLGIKRDVTDRLIDNIRFNDFAARRICSAQVLIIDEVSMLDSVMIDNVDAVLKGVREDDRPFGGVQVVFVGDFFQLPPVSKGESLDFAFESEAWKDANLTICYLTEQHRQSDQEFLEILTAMRNGAVTVGQKATIRACAYAQGGVPATQLYTHNADVDRINEEELAKIEEPEHVFTASCDGVPFMVDLLKKRLLSPERLALKVGAVVMFTRNNFDEGFVNGTIGTVTRFTNDGFPVIETKDGREITPRRAEWVIEENGVVKASVRQIPLRLAWAITVHKSQGMSLDAASVDLSNAFEYGQGYVAISRVRSLAGLHIRGINERAFATHPRVVEQDKEFRRLSESPNLPTNEEALDLLGQYDSEFEV